MLLRVFLEAETPLSFRDGDDLAPLGANHFIPGTNLFGALAEYHRLRRNDPVEFQRFFLQGKVRLGNGYPAAFKARDLNADYLPVQPIPLTARTCKRFKGFAFHADEDHERRAGVTDALIPLALFTLSNEEQICCLADLHNHPKTGQPLDRMEGFFRRGIRADVIGQGNVALGLRTRTGINYRTGTAAAAILYSRQTFAEGARFWGCWSVDDDIYAPFEAFIGEIIERDALRIGNNRTRGFGRVRLNLQELAADTAADLGDRVLAFTDMLHTAATQWAIPIPAGRYIPVTLQSDMLLSDPLLRSRLQVHGDDLAAVGVPGAQLRFHTAGARRIRGWNQLLGMPRADMWAITMGAVFLFHLPPTDQPPWAALLQLQQEGLGLRRGEGFGTLAIASRFHLESYGVYR